MPIIPNHSCTEIGCDKRFWRIVDAAQHTKATGHRVRLADGWVQPCATCPDAKSCEDMAQETV